MSSLSELSGGARQCESIARALSVAARIAPLDVLLDLSAVGGPDAMYKPPAELSQGKRQWVGTARALALPPKMLHLDERFGMLGSLTRFKF